MPVSPIEATARSSTVADHPVESEPDAADAEPDALRRLSHREYRSVRSATRYGRAVGMSMLGDKKP
jgi:hypothetical protein